MRRCGRKDASSDSAASGGASLTSTRPGRLRWIESATASRYIRGERVTSTRIMRASVPVSGTDAALAGENGPKCAEGGPRPADGGPSKAYFLELRKAELHLRRNPVLRSRVNRGLRPGGDLLSWRGQPLHNRSSRSRISPSVV